jgi:hypothetical protein
MKLPRRTFLHMVAGAAALPAVSRFAWAQAYPSKPVRLIVPAAPGGNTDLIARLIGQWLSERLGKAVPPTRRTLRFTDSKATPRLRARSRRLNGGNNLTVRVRADVSSNRVYQLYSTASPSTR